MKNIYIILQMSIWILLNTTLLGAYLEDVPVTITQPNGKTYEVFATGDEFYNWLQDRDSYTIIENPKTGFYCFAILENEELIPSKYVVGRDNPRSTELIKNVNIPTDKILVKRTRKKTGVYYSGSKKQNINEISLKSTQVYTANNLTNIVIFVRFADQTDDFYYSISDYQDIYKISSSGSNSLFKYYQEASYNQLNVMSSFFPSTSGSIVVSYQDSYQRGYFLPKSTNNPIGCSSNDQKIYRVRQLVKRAAYSIESDIPDDLDLDGNNDGKVDNISLVIKGGGSQWGQALWPHYFYCNKDFRIKGKQIYDYNIQLEEIIRGVGNSVLSHEMGHTLGLEDLYHYEGTGIPVGDWCLMSSTSYLPPHLCSYSKIRLGWIYNVPEITNSGTYSLNSMVSAANNCFKIPISNASLTEYLLLEYRKRTGTFEGGLPGSGLVIYRINESNRSNANATGFGGIEDRVYVFRKDGSTSSDGDMSNAYLSNASGRTYFNKTSNPYCFISDGTLGNAYIKNVSYPGNSISFDIRFCDDVDVVISSTNDLPPLTNASNSITTMNSVIVQNTDNIRFEALNEITLNDGFEIETGGIFEISLNGCAD